MKNAEPIAIRRNEPGLGPEPDYSSWIYADPPSHDFCVGLVIAELMRRHYEAPGPLKVRLLTHKGQLGMVDLGARSVGSPVEQWGSIGPVVPKAYSDMMIEHVINPAIGMMGAVREPDLDLMVNPAEIVNCVEYDYHIGHLVDASRQGHPIPGWIAPEWAHMEVTSFLDHERPVVITLRESPWQPERNSNLYEWVKFARSIKDRHPVLFVRDTAKAEVPLTGFRTYPRASYSAYIRAALYRHARMNLMVGNGPGVWAIFSPAPYLIFKQLVPALPDWEHGQPKGWREQDHMEVGDQYPWAGPRQRLTWTDDTLDNITLAFNELMI